MTAAAEQFRYWSVTTLLRAVFGMGEAILYSSAEKLAVTVLDSRMTLDAMLAEQGRDAVIDWLLGRRYETMNKAKDRGTDIHKAAEQLALGLPVSIDAVLMPWVEQYKAWLDLYRPEFLLSEAPCYSHAWRYAGTTDGLMLLDGKRLLFDIKTTEHGPNAKTRKGRPKSRPPFDEVALQLVAYSRADEVGVIADRRYAGGQRYYVIDKDTRREPMPEIDGALCIVVSPEDCYAVPVRIDDEVWHAWLATMNIAQLLLNKTVPLFGPPLYSDGGALEQQLQASVEALA